MGSMHTQYGIKESLYGINTYTTWDLGITIWDQYIHNMGLKNHNMGSMHTQHGIKESLYGINTYTTWD